MLESQFERYSVKKIKERGGRAFKWVCPGTAGIPDRICIFPRGRIIFIEFKKPGRVNGLSERQKKVFKILNELGCSVYRIGSSEELEVMLNDI